MKFREYRNPGAINGFSLVPTSSPWHPGTPSCSLRMHLFPLHFIRSAKYQVKTQISAISRISPDGEDVSRLQPAVSATCIGISRRTGGMPWQGISPCEADLMTCYSPFWPVIFPTTPARIGGHVRGSLLWDLLRHSEQDDKGFCQFSLRFGPRPPTATLHVRCFGEFLKAVRDIDSPIATSISADVVPSQGRKSFHIPVNTTCPTVRDAFNSRSHLFPASLMELTQPR